MGMKSEDYRKFIIESAELLIRKADEIVSDLSFENVSNIYISLSLSNDTIPSLDIKYTIISLLADYLFSVNSIRTE